MKAIKLVNKTKIFLNPQPPYNFNANFHKPSHFPSSDNRWEENQYWITMLWKGRMLGLKFENKGRVDKPKIQLTVYSKKKLGEKYFLGILPEIRWRFNFDQDISSFCGKYKNDEFLKEAIKKWEGMKPIAAHSLYGTLIIYFVLQNAAVRRSVQMLENLFNKFGKKVEFDGKALSIFWEPKDMAKASEANLRELKVGYRAKFFKRLSEQFTNKEIDEFALRKKNKEEVEKEILNIFGVGPASAEYLLFEDMYFLDALKTVPPWEQKIMSKLLFDQKLVSTQKIVNFFKKRYGGYEKLAFHYIWENLFWKRKKVHIGWLEKEIRL
ncbi:hypothetical protein HY643_00740 [Candidatus Woesearchaeota archaeon]|nr:hypothetical protein [Candidatus Woesearchaeota archaeon]